MNPMQMALQIQHKLQAVRWPTGAADVVFGSQKASSVHIFAGRPTEDQIPAGMPFCMIGINAGEMDEDHPEFIEQSFTLLTVVEVAGDPLGEFAMIGGSVADLGKSVGRGILEVATLVREAVENLLGVDGAKVMLSSTATGSPKTLGRGLHIGLDELVLTAFCTSELHYAEPQQIAVNGSTWTWEGAHVSDRFDFLQYVLRRKPGSAPTGPEDGAEVYTGAAATVTHTPVTTDTYGIFAQYDDRGDGIADGSSEAAVVGTNLTPLTEAVEGAGFSTPTLRFSTVPALRIFQTPRSRFPLLRRRNRRITRNRMPHLISGQSLFYNTGTAYYTPWTAAGGNGANTSFHLLARHGSGTITVTVETKKPGDDDSNIGATSWNSGAVSAVQLHTFKAGQEVGDGGTAGFLGLVRLKIAIGGTVSADGIYFEMLPMQWLA